MSRGISRLCGESCKTVWLAGWWLAVGELTRRRLVNILSSIWLNEMLHVVYSHVLDWIVHSDSTPLFYLVPRCAVLRCQDSVAPMGWLKIGRELVLVCTWWFVNINNLEATYLYCIRKVRLVYCYIKAGISGTAKNSTDLLAADRHSTLNWSTLEPGLFVLLFFLLAHDRFLQIWSAGGIFTGGRLGSD